MLHKWINYKKFDHLWRYLLFRRARDKVYNFIHSSLTKNIFFLFNQQYKIELYFGFVENITVTSSILTKYMVRKLKYRYTLNELISHIKRVVVTNLHGLRIKCSGRFTRRQRAAILRRSFGCVSLSTIGYNVDYSYRPVTMKYGVGGIKIWISR